MIWNDCRITTSELYATIAMGKVGVMAIITELNYRKVCALWVLKILTVKHETV
jgi:hypothetical protein